MSESRKKIAAIHTLGCKVNQVESAQIADSLRRLGFEVIMGFPSSPVDFAVVNTCAVTHKAEAESRRALLRMARCGGLTVAAGCSAQMSGPELSESTAVDHILGNRRKGGILDLARSLSDLPDIPPATGEPSGENRFQDLGDGYLTQKTRAFLKVQDGCNAFCSYCIVPHARGPSRSLPFEAAIERFKSLADKGFREIVLTGIHLGFYGVDLTPPRSLLKLVAELEESDFQGRIRLSSLEPTEVDEAFIAFLKRSRRLCPHLHLPLQSGDSETLRRMNRHYSAEDYAAVVQTLQEAIPTIAVGADVLVGFPGESPAAFERTVELIERLPLSHLHVFPYSPRKDTPAASFSGQVKEAEKKRRVALLRDLGLKKKLFYFRSLVGERAQVLVQEAAHEEGFLRGLSERYVPVIFKGDGSLMGRLVNVTLTAVVDGPNGPAMSGEMYKQESPPR